MLNYVLIMPTCRCVFLLGTNSFGWNPLPPISSSHFLLLWCYLDANLHRLHHLPQLPFLYVLMKALHRGTPSFSTLLAHLVIATDRQKCRLALLLLVLDKTEDVTQWESHLTLATGQQVMVGVQARWQCMDKIMLQ